jgi:hypothetical protein
MLDAVEVGFYEISRVESQALARGGSVFNPAWLLESLFHKVTQHKCAAASPTKSFFSE